MNQKLRTQIEKIKKELPLDRTTVWKHLNGRRKPDLESMRVYAGALGMTLEEFDRLVNDIPSPSGGPQGPS